MASIYKRSRDKKKKNIPYQIEYVDADGLRRVVKGFTGKGLTEQLAAKLENEVLLRKRGMIDPLAEQLAVRRQSLIGDSLDAFRRSMDNTTPKHQKLTMTRVSGPTGAEGGSAWRRAMSAACSAGVRVRTLLFFTSWTPFFAGSPRLRICMKPCGVTVRSPFSFDSEPGLWRTVIHAL